MKQMKTTRNKVVKLNSGDINKNNLQLNNRANLLRLEAALNNLAELNIEKQTGTVGITEYHLRRSKIIKKLYSPE